MVIMQRFIASLENDLNRFLSKRHDMGFRNALSFNLLPFIYENLLSGVFGNSVAKSFYNALFHFRLNMPSQVI